MRVGVCRNLRQVGNAEDLKCGTQRPQFPADNVSDPAANARIDQMAEMLAKLMEDKEGEPAPKRKGRPPNAQAAA